MKILRSDSDMGFFINVTECFCCIPNPKFSLKFIARRLIFGFRNIFQKNSLNIYRKSIFVVISKFKNLIKKNSLYYCSSNIELDK